MRRYWLVPAVALGLMGVVALADVARGDDSYIQDRLRWGAACGDLRQATDNLRPHLVYPLTRAATQASIDIAENYMRRYCGWTIWLPWKGRPS